MGCAAQCEKASIAISAQVHVHSVNNNTVSVNSSLNFFKVVRITWDPKEYVI